MSPKSISGLVYQVSDVGKTADFYEALGLGIEKRDPKLGLARLNWFWVEFHEGMPAKESGPLVYLSVDNVEEFYHNLIVKHISPASELAEAFGRREFSVHDPDGYQLVFFQKI